MREEIAKDLAQAYGDLSRPSYAFAARRLNEGMHGEVVRALSRAFVVDDQTSLGSDDVCITLFVRPHDAPEEWTWSVQISLVGNYAVVSRMGHSRAPWPITEAHDDQNEVALLATLRRAGIELVSYALLREPTALRPPNSGDDEVYTVYNAPFTDMVPFQGEPLSVGAKPDT
jgi:hypothetical protein